MGTGNSLLKEMTEDIRKIINCSTEPVSDKQVLELIEDYVLHDQRTNAIGYKTKIHLVDGVFNATRMELDILQPLADNSEISEIMVNGIDNIFIEKEGRIIKTDLKFEGKEQLEEIIRRIAGKVHREINELNPIVDARLEDGSRVNAVYKNIALDGPILTIRRFPSSRITMKELIDKQSISAEAADFLEKLVVAGYNIFISGGTSSGKTTFLNVLSNYIPKDERVIVIEDSAELQIKEIDNLVRLETKNANVQGKGEITIRQLIKTSLRMRPDRIIVGEVRGGEVIDMIQAMNTGHDGSLSTGHANSPSGMISRLESMYLTTSNFPIEAIRSQIASAIDIIVHLARLKDKSRKVIEITEVEGYENGQIILNTLFKYKITGEDIGGNLIGVFERTENRLKNTIKMDMKCVPMQ
jgi:pilus assembly protein CpaF